MTDLWDRLSDHRAAQGDLRIETLFGDSARADDFCIQADGLAFDYSKTLIDAAARDLLVALAEDARLDDRRAAMFGGAAINETEGRAVLHTALRNPDTPVFVGGQDVTPGIRDTLARMRDFAQAVRSGSIAGQGGAYTDVVNIGIGGSDLGPAMAARALSPFVDGPRLH
ncbi:MAG: glucose-6-phosphate isomerase, partial [Paracoccus sp. (in: a-proteobacteria)]|nr:glucose-6-phosphate isomerase [Paracoccus sp. (in: a-proteobacteria)]